MSPELYNLSLQRWAFFVTLTFRSKDDKGNPVKVPDEKARQRMLFAFLRTVAKGAKRNRETGKRVECVPFEQLLWVAREERGELNGRYHFHILIDGLPKSRENRTEGFVWKTFWNDLGGGFSDIRRFDSSLPGVQYVLKGLEVWSRSHANSYEARKFDENDHEGRRLIVAKACVRKWARRTEQRASGGTQLQSCTVSLVGSRKAALTRAKETTEAELRRSFGLNMHPAGVSFVR